MDNIRLLIAFGGPSEEHDVSVKSARELARALPAFVRPVWANIGRDGAWRLTTGPDAAPQETLALSLDPARRGLLDKSGEYIPVDMAFPMLHGRFGEDGGVQGLLEAAGIPYVGCGIAASALCMDKSLTYLAAARAGVETPRHVVLEAGEDAPETLPFGYPAYVKPARSGSSFGVTRVTGPEGLAEAVKKARAFDMKVLIEEGMRGCEVGVAILGTGKELTCGEPDELRTTDGLFRVHQEKDPEHRCESAEILVPAEIGEEARGKVLEAAKRVYRAAGCSGLARVDMFWTGDGRAVLNEVNTMPGMTSYSRYPRMMRAAGWTMERVVTRLLALTANSKR